MDVFSILLIIFIALLTGLAFGSIIYLLLSMLQAITYDRVLDEQASQLGERNPYQDTSGSIASRLSTWLLEFEFGQRFTDLVARAEIGYSPGRIFLYIILMTLILGVIGQLLNAGLIVSLLLMATGGVIPFFWLQGQTEKRNLLIYEQLPDSIDVVANALSAGASIQQAFEASLSELPYPIVSEFSQINAEMKVGSSLAEALENFRNRVPLSALDNIIAAILIQKRSGGNLPELLTEISDLLKEDFSLQRELGVETSQAQMSARVVGIAPIVVFIVMYIFNPEYMRPMTSTTLGITMLVGAFLMEALGYYLVQRVSSIEV